ncbi:MAG: ribonuclease III [Actinomycetota bacterium]
MATTQDDRLSRLTKQAVRSGLEALGVPAEGGALYNVALTHRSFAFEQSEETPHNERLEFLGDAILGAVVTDLIYLTYPDLSEGQMARLRASVVNTHALAEVGRAVGLGEHIRVGKGEEASGGKNKDSLLADTFEAVVGAVYVERGLEVVRDATVPIFVELLARSLEDIHRFDAKTALQEVVVARSAGFPSYRVTASGPDHSKRFEASVFIDGELCGHGSGTSKKEAEQGAARAALEGLAVEAGLPTPPGPPRRIEGSGAERGGAGARAS